MLGQCTLKYSEIPHIVDYFSLNIIFAFRCNKLEGIGKFDRDGDLDVPIFLVMMPSMVC